MANFNFNKVILGGRLTSDPELKQTGSGIAVVTFTLAVNRRFHYLRGSNSTCVHSVDVKLERRLLGVIIYNG